MDEFLLLVESVFFLIGTVLLFRKERLYGVYFFLIYVYVIFSQIGYLYVPELSVSIFAYFGEQMWRPATFFVILSGVSLFSFLMFASGPLEGIIQPRLVARVQLFPAARGGSRHRFASLLITTLLFLQTCIFLFDYSSISWENAQKEEVFSTTLALGIFILLVKLSVGINLALYCLLRQQTASKQTRSSRKLFVASLLLFLLFTFKLGNRTDDVAFFLGIVVFETSRLQLRPRHFAIALGIAAMLIAYLNFLEAHRYEDGPAEVDFATKVLLKDYYSPAHILFAAIGNQATMPFQVITSNAANALMFLGQPYLQAPVTDLFYPGGATRGASYGFYPFTEGYLFAGFYGFIYNGVVLGALLVLWRSLARTGSPEFNDFLLALLGSMMVNLVRGQSSYYIKYLYTFVLPNAALYLCLMNQRVRWQPVQRKLRSRNLVAS